MGFGERLRESCLLWGQPKHDVHKEVGWKLTVPSAPRIEASAMGRGDTAEVTIFISVDLIVSMSRVKGRGCCCSQLPAAVPVIQHMSARRTVENPLLCCGTM